MGTRDMTHWDAGLGCIWMHMMHAHPDVCRARHRSVAETCEFDGKEPLFVETTIAISIRVLG